MKNINILLVDDQQIIRDGLESLLKTQDNFTIIGQASNGLEAIAFVEHKIPDVILMDIRMPMLNGVEATKQILEKYKTIKIIILTTFDDDEFILEAMSYGASGYLLKDTSSEKLITAINDSINGNIILPGQIAMKIVSHISKKDYRNVNLDDFSEREKDIIKLLVEGKTNQQISDKLFLSIGTVKNYLSQIYSKSNTTDRTNAILFFKELGL